MRLPDTIPFADALSRLYNDILRPYEDVWSEALLKQREKLASRERSRGSNSSDGGSGSGPSSARNIPTSLKFSEPSRSSSNGPPPPPVPPPYDQPTASSYNLSASTSTYNPHVSQPPSWPNASSSSGPPPAPREQTVAEVLAESRVLQARAEARRLADQQPQQRYSPTPFSQPPPVGSIAALFASAPTPSDSGRFEELEPASKKGRTSAGSTRAGSSVGQSPAGSTQSRDSPRDHDSPQGRKRARAPDTGALPTPPSADPYTNFGAPGPNPNQEPVPPSFEFTSAGWTGAGTWPPSYGLDGEFDLGQYIASASPALSADTPDLVAAQGNDQSPGSDDQEPEPNARKGIAVDTMGSGWSAPAIVSPYSFGPQSGVSDQWDATDTEKWPMPPAFDFDESFGWTT